MNQPSSVLDLMSALQLLHFLFNISIFPFFYSFFILQISFLLRSFPQPPKSSLRISLLSSVSTSLTESQNILASSLKFPCLHPVSFSRWCLGTSLVVQQLRSHASYAEGAGWIPGQGAKIHMLRITAKGKDSVPQSFVYLLFFSLLLDIQMHIQMTLF